MKRLSLVAVALVALALPANVSAASFFLFDRAEAAPNDRATVRTGNTPRNFVLSRRVKPFQRPIRLYLVRADLAAEVHSRFDSRLHFLGVLVPDRNGRGLVRFSVPPLDAGTYTIAYRCPGCAAFSRGRTFFVQQPLSSSRATARRPCSRSQRARPARSRSQSEPTPGTAPRRNVVRERPPVGGALLRRRLRGVPGPCRRRRLDRQQAALGDDPALEEADDLRRATRRRLTPASRLRGEHGLLLGQLQPLAHESGELPLRRVLAATGPHRRRQPYVRRQRRRVVAVRGSAAGSERRAVRPPRASRRA